MNTHNETVTVILDDDPTRTQTFHGINVLTRWDHHALVIPDFFIAKGGITSSDIASSKALEVMKARIIGQAMPGVHVWRLGKESRFLGLPDIVFPGNVRRVGALEKLVSKLLHSHRQNQSVT